MFAGGPGKCRLNAWRFKGGVRIHLKNSGSASLALGTILTVIENTSTSAISGSFANLADGSTIIVGVNKFQVSYSGADEMT